MKTPNVGDVVTVFIGSGRCVRAEVWRSHKRRFLVALWMPDPWQAEKKRHERTNFSFERLDEGKTWVRGWDDETAVAFRAEVALAACR